MAGLPRYTQKIFGLDAGSNQMSKYGSFLSTPELYSGATITPDIIQALSNFEGGMYDGVGGAYSPTIQDFNSLFRLFTQGLAYYFTRGIPEWDAGTTYNANDFCKVGNGIYYSLIDDNTDNNPTSSPLDWQLDNAAPVNSTQQIFLTGSGTYTLPTSPRKPRSIRIRMAGGGAGGAGGTNSIGTSGGDGADGADSTFGTSLLVAKGGKKGSVNVGGAGGFGGTSTGINFAGQAGGNGMLAGVTTASSSITINGGGGGQNFFAGAHTGAFEGVTATLNTGCGGTGGGAEILIGQTGSINGGGGGGAGEYIDITITNPANTYAFSVGNFGNGGSAGDFQSGSGAPGAKGIIIVDENY